MKHCLLSLVFSIGLFANGYGQEPVQTFRTRHRFAEMYAGADVGFYPGQHTGSKKIMPDGSLQEFVLDDYAGSRLLIGATHFWGHADFFLAIPVARFKEASFVSGVETGARWFPWKIKRQALRPWLGVSLASRSYKQGEGVRQDFFQTPVSAGMSFRKRNHLIEFSGGMDFGKARRYYISREVSTKISMHSLHVTLSWKYLFDITLSAEKDWQSGQTQRLTDALAARGKLNGWTVSAGPSSSFYLKTSTHNSKSHPYLGQHKIARLFPEAGIGYYFHRPDLQINLSYRQIKSELSAYGFHQKLRRTALTLESYRFMGDYHGFAPFIGPALSYEFLKVSEGAAGDTETKSARELIRPGITFGWDIRPNRIQTFYLRTNLRWFPALSMKSADAKKISFDQLEFNFIQLVIFPGRMF